MEEAGGSGPVVREGGLGTERSPDKYPGPAGTSVVGVNESTVFAVYLQVSIKV